MTLAEPSSKQQPISKLASAILLFARSVIWKDITPKVIKRFIPFRVFQKLIIIFHCIEHNQASLCERMGGNYFFLVGHFCKKRY